MIDPARSRVGRIPQVIGRPRVIAVLSVNLPLILTMDLTHQSDIALKNRANLDSLQLLGETIDYR